MKTFARQLMTLLLPLVLAVGCAPSSLGPSAVNANAVGEAAGFWKGLWHGFIVLFTFIVSLFNDEVGIYELYNRGHLYDLGFLLGIMIFFGSSGGGACRKSK